METKQTSNRRSSSTRLKPKIGEKSSNLIPPKTPSEGHSLTSDAEREPYSEIE